MTEMAKVVAIFGGPTGQPEANANTIAVLEEWLQLARDGQIIGVAMASLECDGLARWAVAGNMGGYSTLGALDIARADLIDHIREMQ